MITAGILSLSLFFSLKGLPNKLVGLTLLYFCAKKKQRRRKWEMGGGSKKEGIRWLLRQSFRQ